MKFITTSTDYRKAFLSLMEEYGEYYFATAWAGMPNDIIDSLKINKQKIKQFAVGVDFCHTDPDFLLEYRLKILITKQASGTFHPKVFLFFNADNDWKVIVGSANFTQGAFYKNAEAVVLAESSDEDSSHFLNDVRHYINSCCKKGSTITEDEIAGYRLRWKKAKKIAKQQEEWYNRFSSEAWIPTDFMQYNWEEYVVEFDGWRERVEIRVEMLSQIKSIFATKHSLKNMTEQERRLIAGMPNDINQNWADFGTSGNGKYMNKMRLGNEIFSRALDQIPLIGEISRENYDSFVEIFLTDEHTSTNWMSSAGRLLAMKRPDTFYSLTGTNRSGFCEDFGIDYNDVNLNTYWELVVKRILISDWWNAHMPKARFQRNLWETRAAMLDVLYYEGF